MRTSKLLMSVLAVLALVAAACGDDDGAEASAPATTAAPAVEEDMAEE